MQNLTVEHVLDLIKSRNALKSDYMVCKTLNLSTALVSGWRSGRTLPDERMCQKLAEAAGIDPLVLAASMQSQRSKTEEARSLWAMVAERLQMVPQALAAAAFAMLFATNFVATDAHAQGAQQVSAAFSASDSSIHRV
ncbi:hypothetical protein FSY59_16780 [Comamonas sp. Z3]|uniref:hypothetical protein n=1 Tax=Comamonas sp. Z3 TaxID=2601247 RepID=UPI0011E6C986|nr:hypothetical protein [Comamonas sp. Z3]TYK69964.1 hypothetical protein FSY59_16780 [Comamonas sp. Z3]